MNIWNSFFQADASTAARMGYGFRKTGALLLLVCLAVGGSETQLEKSPAIPSTPGRAIITAANLPMTYYLQHGMWRADARSFAAAVQFLLEA